MGKDVRYGVGAELTLVISVRWESLEKEEKRE